MARVTAIVNDLFFMTRIRNAAEYFGLTVGFVSSENQIDHYVRDCQLILVDLDSDFLDPLNLVQRLKSNSETASIKLIGYLSRLNSHVRSQASEAGCDSVLSRPEFSSNLKEILRIVCS